MPTRAWRAICSRGASRPWSQNTCRAASTMASRLRWASRRSGRGPGRSEVVMCAVYGNTEACLRIVLEERSTGGPPPFMEGVVAMTTNVETTGRDAVLVQDAAQIQMMGLPVLEAL